MILEIKCTDILKYFTYLSINDKEIIVDFIKKSKVILIQINTIPTRSNIIGRWLIFLNILAWVWFSDYKYEKYIIGEMEPTWKNIYFYKLNL